MGRRLIDWRFVAMLSVMLLVMVACWGFVARQKQVDSLIEIARHEQENAADARREQQASNERDAAQIAALLKKVAGLQRQGHNVAAQNRALLDYLKAHGLSPPDLSFSGGGSPHPKGQAPSGARPPTQPSPSMASPTARPTGTPSPGIGITDPLCALLQLDPCPLSRR